MKQLKRITFIHLFNDFSGSPLVLSTVIGGLRDRGYQCRLMTSKGSTGFLTDIEGVEEALFPYRFVENKFLRLLVFFWTQCLMCFKVWKDRKSIDTLYINTLLPFGAAIAGKLSGIEVIYHIHETSVKPMVLKRWLRWVAQKCATQSIYVSKYLCSEEVLPGVPSHTVYNALSKDFIAKANAHLRLKKPKSSNFEVLMLCSLKAYKGVNEFVKIAGMLPGVQFNLVINASQSAIGQYFEGESIPSNLTMYPSQSNVHPFYESAHLILNLSHPQQWIETFGMTLLEGMAYGLPCIVPQVGGPAEIIKHGLNGYQLDQRDIESIVSHIAKLSLDKNLYGKMSSNALSSSKEFSCKNMVTSVYSILALSNEIKDNTHSQAIIH